jgi:hypothetical protein
LGRVSFPLQRLLHAQQRTWDTRYPCSRTRMAASTAAISFSLETHIGISIPIYLSQTNVLNHQIF